MKRSNYKTTGYYIVYISAIVFLFLTLVFITKNIRDRWISSIDAEQYNEMIQSKQDEGFNVSSDGESIVIKSNKAILWDGKQ